MNVRSPKGQFRRKFPRRSFGRRISLLSAGVYYLATAVEIGEGGLSFLMPEMLNEGVQLVINFRVPGGDFLSLRAEVRSVHSAENGVLHGVAFQGIPFSYKRQIRAFVSSRSESESLII